MRRVVEATVFLLVTMLFASSVYGGDEPRNIESQWSTLAQYVLFGLALLIIAIWSVDAFGRAKAEVRDREVPVRFLALRNQFTLGSAVFVVICMVFFSLIFFFHEGVIAVVAIWDREMAEKWDKLLSLGNPSYFTIVSFSCAVFAALLKVEKEWNPILVFRKMILKWISIPHLANELVDIIMDRMIVPRTAVPSLLGAHPEFTLDFGDFDSHQVQKRRWTMVSYIRWWLEDQKHRDAELEFFREPCFEWDDLVRHYELAALSREEQTEGAKEIHEKFAIVAASYLIANNPSRPELAKDCEQFGIKLPEVPQQNPFMLTIVYLGCLIIGCYIGVSISAIVFDWLTGTPISTAIFPQDPEHRVRWTALALGNYGIPIFVILLIRNIIWRAYPTRVYSRIFMYCGTFILALVVAPIGLSLAVQGFGSEAVRVPWPQFWSLPMKNIPWAFGPALTCVLISHNLDIQIDEGSREDQRRAFLQQVGVSLLFTACVLVFTALALGGIEPGGEWSIAKRRWVALGTSAVITLTLGLISQMVSLGPKPIREFWRGFRRFAGLRNDHYTVKSFGDSPEMATELANLVFEGIKRATASLARDYGGREPMPKPGDFVIVPDGEKRPQFIRQTTEVVVKPLSEVDEAFAWDAGEGDRTRDWWLAAHRRYFARQAGREGFELDDQILTVFERFEVVWPRELVRTRGEPQSASAERMTISNSDPKHGVSDDTDIAYLASEKGPAEDRSG